LLLAFLVIGAAPIEATLIGDHAQYSGGSHMTAICLLAEACST
jgi:hypothetical protein